MTRTFCDKHTYNGKEICYNKEYIYTLNGGPVNKRFNYEFRVYSGVPAPTAANPVVSTAANPPANPCDVLNGFREAIKSDYEFQGFGNYGNYGGARFFKKKKSNRKRKVSRQANNTTNKNRSRRNHRNRRKKARSQKKNIEI